MKREEKTKQNWEMGGISNESWTRTKEPSTKAGQQRIRSSEGNRTGRSTSAWYFCQLTSFFQFSFWLCLSDSLVSLCASRSRGVLSGCQAQACHILTEPAHCTLSHIGKKEKKTNSWLNWALDRSPTRAQILPLKGTDRHLTSQLWFRGNQKHSGFSVQPHNTDTICSSRCTKSCAKL